MCAVNYDGRKIKQYERNKFLLLWWRFLLIPYWYGESEQLRLITIPQIKNLVGFVSSYLKLLESKKVEETISKKISIQEEACFSFINSLNIYSKETVHFITCIYAGGIGKNQDIYISNTQKVKPTLKQVDAYSHLANYKSTIFRKMCVCNILDNQYWCNNFVYIYNDFIGNKTDEKDLTCFLIDVKIKYKNIKNDINKGVNSMDDELFDIISKKVESFVKTKASIRGLITWEAYEKSGYKNPIYKKFHNKICEEEFHKIRNIDNKKDLFHYYCAQLSQHAFCTVEKERKVLKALNGSSEKWSVIRDMLALNFQAHKQTNYEKKED